MKRKTDRRPPPPRKQDDPHEAPESGDKPDAARPAAEPAPARRQSDRDADAAAPQDNDPMAPDSGDKLAGGPMGR